MTSKGKFHIPSLDEIDHSELEKDKTQPPRLFSSIQSSNAEDTQLKSAQHPTCQLSSNHKDAVVEHPGSTLKDKRGAKDYQPGSETPSISITKSDTVEQSQKITTASSQKCSNNLHDNNEKKDIPSKPAKGNALLVSPRQRGNPILKYVRSVPWEFDDIVPDYQLGQTSCALFLSLRYHNLNPNYVHERLKQLGHSFDLRVLLVQVDVKDPHHSLKDLAKICLLADCTLIVAFSAEEAGVYLETYKAFEHKPPEMIMEKLEANFMGKMTDSLTTVRQVNKTDVQTLMSTFKSLEGIVQASEEDLSLCPGFGPQKASRLHTLLHQSFLKSKK